MPKLNRIDLVDRETRNVQRISLIQFIKEALRGRHKDSRDVDKRRAILAYGFVHDIDAGIDNYGFSHKVLSVLQPLADSVKDIVDTFKPYKSKFYLKRDVKQPIIGLKRLGEGALLILIGAIQLAVGVLALIVLSAIIGPFYAAKHHGYRSKMPPFLAFFKMATSLVVGALKTLFHGILLAAHGLMLVVTTPLSYLFKIPTRAILTVAKGQPLIEDSRLIQKSTDKALRLLSKDVDDAWRDKMIATLATIDYTYQKCRRRLQQTRIRSNAENDRYVNSYDKIILPQHSHSDLKKHCLDYLRLFRPGAEVEVELEEESDELSAESLKYWDSNIHPSSKNI